MLADFFKKSLQVVLFQKFRLAIMNVLLEIRDDEMVRVLSDVAVTKDTAKYFP